MEIAAEAEQARTADKNTADLKRCGWRCWWCLAYDPDHSPDKCTAREMPDMSDFSQRKPRTRQGSSRRAPSARPQTTRTAQEQRLHEAQHKSAWQERNRDLRAAAIERTTEFVNDLTAPIVGSGPLGQYTRAQMLGLEFALTLPSHFQDMPGFLDQVRRAHTRPTQRPTDTRRLPRAQAPHSKINASALQRFARQVKADGAFDSVASLRGPGEQPITDFVLLHLRARYQNGRSDDLLNPMQQRAGHPRRSRSSWCRTCRAWSPSSAKSRWAGRPRCRRRRLGCSQATACGYWRYRRLLQQRQTRRRRRSC